MTRTLLITIILLVCLRPPIFAQTYSTDNSAKVGADFNFGLFLLQSRQYNLAKLEFERLNFKYPGNDSIQLKLLEAYRLSADFERGLRKANVLKQSKSDATNAYALSYHKEAIRNLIHLKDFKGVATEAAQSEILHPAHSLYWSNMEIGAFILLDEWPSIPAEITANQALDPVLLQNIYDLNNIKRVSPFRAGLYSTLLPGAGKVYAGSWKDGLLSFLFVGANTYSAYRGFSRNGAGSVYGWVFTGLATGFYLGNIYGSASLAKKQNLEKKKRIQQQSYERLLLIY